MSSQRAERESGSSERIILVAREELAPHRPDLYMELDPILGDPALLEGMPGGPFVVLTSESFADAMRLINLNRGKIALLFVIAGKNFPEMDFSSPDDKCRIDSLVCSAVCPKEEDPVIPAVVAIGPADETRKVENYARYAGGLEFDGEGASLLERRLIVIQPPFSPESVRVAILARLQLAELDKLGVRLTDNYF